ncbi:MAG TPA: dockerin type I domain-containing protein [Tepidisphaeraceae bacterium]|jgi:hypothetical protein|nr:dockerin type I domain-containing protein [Tepidisphaeraceae bacterium]
MRSNRRFTVLSAAVATVSSAFVVPVVHATVAFDGTTSYTQNFDTLPSSPLNANGVIWSNDYPATTAPQGTVSLPGWFIQSQTQQAAASGNWQRFRNTTGSTNTGAITSFGVAATDPVGERALGFVPATTVGTQWVALRLENTSAQTITGLTISYDGEEWRNGTLTTAQTMAFGYAVEAGSIQGTYSLNSNLNFTAPIANGGNAALDGNAPANRQAGITSNLTGLDWQPGQDLWIRWTMPGVSGSQGLALDNLTVSGAITAAGASSPTWNLAAANGTWNATDSSNWLNGNSPTGTGGLVRLGSQITADRTVTLDTSPTVDTLEFNGGAHNYTLAANPGDQLNINAGGSIVTNGVSFNTDNTLSAGNQISAPLNFATDAFFQVNDPLGKLTVTGAITVGAGGGLHLAGAGSVTLPPSFIWSGPTTIDGASISISSPAQLGDGSATNSIVLDNGGSINITADLNLGRSLIINPGGGTIQTANNVTLGGNLTPGGNGSGIFTKLGAGTLVLSAPRVGGLFLTGGNSTASAGVLQIAPDGTNTGVSKISFLRIQTDVNGLYLGKLDLANNSLVYDYSGATPLTNVITYNGVSTGTKVAVALWYAYDGAHWDRNGIMSSYIGSADNDPNKIHSVAYAEASTLLGLTGSQTATWNGQTVDATSVLLKYTYAGDVNMDGKIDADDYAIIDRTIAKGLFTTEYADATGSTTHARWTDGDFNFDGAVDSKDMLILDTSNGVLSGGLSPSFLAEREAEYGSAYVSSLLASIPEPASLSLLLAALPLAIRRRRVAAH